MKGNVLTPPDLEMLSITNMEYSEPFTNSGTSYHGNVTEAASPHTFGVPFSEAVPVAARVGKLRSMVPIVDDASPANHFWDAAMSLAESDEVCQQQHQMHPHIPASGTRKHVFQKNVKGEQQTGMRAAPQPQASVRRTHHRAAVAAAFPRRPQKTS